MEQLQSVILLIAAKSICAELLMQIWASEQLQRLDSSDSRPERENQKKLWQYICDIILFNILEAQSREY